MAATGDQVPLTAQPALPAMPFPKLVLWFLLICLLAFSNPVVWSLTLRFAAHTDIPLAVGAVALAGVLYFSNYKTRMWLRKVRPDAYQIMLGMDFCMFGAVVASVVNNISMMYYNPQPMLGDLGFYLLPEIKPGDGLYIVSDLLVDGIGPIIFIYCVFFVDDVWKRANVGRNCFARVGAVQFMRAFTTAVTRLPGPATHCRPGPTLHYDQPSEFIEIFAQLGHMAGAVKNCGDLIYSGHGSSLLACLLCIAAAACEKRSLCVQRIIKGTLFVYAAAFFLFAVASRKHYSVDVVVAYMVVWLMGEKFDHPWQYMRSFFPKCETREAALARAARRPRTKSNIGVGSDFEYDAQTGTVVAFETRSLNV